MKKVFLILICLVVVGFFGWKIFQKLSESKKGGGSGGGRRRDKGAFEVPVVAASVKQQTIRNIGEFTGSLLADSEFKIAPKIAGKLENLDVHIGDWVENGQLIAEIDPKELAEDVNLAKAELGIAEAKLATVVSVYPKEVEKAKTDVTRWEATVNLAKKELERLDKLMAKSVTSVAERDRAYEKLLVAEAQLLAMRKECELAEVKVQEMKREAEAEVKRYKALLQSKDVKLRYTKIRAVWDDGNGKRIIGERFVDEGAFLSPGSPIVSILDIDNLTGIIHVTEKDYPKLKVGQTVQITTDAYPGKAFGGTIVRVSPYLEELSREARVDIKIPNKDHLLKPGMFIRTKIEFGKHDNAPTVPRDALVTRRGKEGVFVIDSKDMTASFVPVKKGYMNQESIEIVEPAIKGKVVTLGHHMLSEKSKVLLPRPKTESKKKEPGKSGKAQKGEAK